MYCDSMENRLSKMYLNKENFLRMSIMAEFWRKLILLFSHIFARVIYRRVRYSSIYTFNYLLFSLRKKRLNQKKLRKSRIDSESWIIDSFLTFSNKGYMYPRRILHQAIETGWFKQVNCADETWIRNMTPNQINFCRARKYDGYGLWIWKPVIIELQLKSMKENEILLYCDSGMYLNSEGNENLSNYLANLEINNEDVILFSVNSSVHSTKMYTEIHLFNRGLLQSMNLSYPGEFDTQLYAGLMLLKNTENTRKFVGRWKELCLDIPLLTQVRDADNGLLNFSKLPDLKFTIYPGNEVNIYEESGLQKKHALSAKEYRDLDWSELSASPFQCRRIK